MKIAISGATGQLGQLVIEHLLKLTAKENIVALARNEETAQNLLQLGIEVRLFDYDRTETLRPALQGIDKLLLISGNEIGRRTAQHKAVIDAAVAAHLPYIAYTSLLKADSSPLALAQEHRETEQLIRDSGLRYTILRNNWYVENYLAALSHNIATGTLLGAAQNARISAAPRRDYAEAAARVLLSQEHDFKSYELASSEAFSLQTLAHVITQVSHKTVKYQNLSAEQYTAALNQAGLDQGLIHVIVEADIEAQHDALYSDSKDLQQLLGRPTTTLETIISDAI